MIPVLVEMVIWPGVSQILVLGDDGIVVSLGTVETSGTDDDAAKVNQLLQPYVAVSTRTVVIENHDIPALLYVYQKQQTEEEEAEDSDEDKLSDTATETEDTSKPIWRRWYHSPRSLLAAVSHALRIDDGYHIDIDRTQARNGHDPDSHGEWLLQIHGLGNDYDIIGDIVDELRQNEGQHPQ